MRFSAGDRLGRFEILGSLGAGGMGEVYRARDLQLQREVAIKVLPPAISDDPGRRRRFEQEARVAGSLSHPNVLAVHDIGIEGDVPYIVSELLEGETLRDRMGGRPLPIRKAVEYAAQIASGLAAGHDRGIVHRDIKPENVFVTTDGRIKILDFGLAKLIGGDSSSSGNTETVTIEGEQRTPVMGTVAYMSPEQARGLRIDHRTDIFSFGVVLYEMLAGFAPFRRGTTSETLNAIMHDDPTPVPAGVASPALERIILHCLEKAPDERFQNARDLVFNLESRGSQSASALLAPGRRRALGRAVRWAAGVLAVIGVAAAAGYVAATRSRAGAPASVIRTRTMTDFRGLEEFSSISPDGRQIAYTAIRGGRRQIFLHLVAGGPHLPLTADNLDHQHPRWLPDGSALIYFSPEAPGEVQGAIYSIPALGGAPRHVIASVGGGDVNSDRRLACFRLKNDLIQLVTTTLEGTDERVIQQFAPPVQYYGYPRWSPDGRWIAYQRGDGFRWDVHIVPTDGGPARQLTRERDMIRGLTWRADSGAVIYAAGSGTTIPYLPPLSIWEVSLADGAQLNVMQRWLPFLFPRQENPRQITPAEVWHEQPDVNAGGLMSATRMRMTVDVWRYPVDGAAALNVSRGQQLTHQTGQVRTPTAAPDGRIAYISDTGGHANLWVTSSQGQAQQITFEEDPSVAVGVPVWSPDGRWIAFVSSKGNVGNVFGIWIVKPDGSERTQLVPKGLGVAWSSDSEWLYFVEDANRPVKKVRVSGGEPVQIRSTPARNLIGVHGSTLYYLVDRRLTDGRPQFEILKSPLGEGDPTVVATIPASRVESWQLLNPSLSPDGNWLALLLTDRFTTNIWKLSTETGSPQPLQQVTDFGDRAVFIARRVAWSADSKFILAAVGEGDSDVVLLDGLIAAAATAR
jgi:Tol biopolymer transport system component